MMANESDVLSHAARNSLNYETSKPKVTMPVTRQSSSDTRIGTRAAERSVMTVFFLSVTWARRDNPSARRATLKLVAETTIADPNRPSEGSRRRATSSEPTAAPNVLAA